MNSGSTYTLIIGTTAVTVTRKAVRRINLRVRSDGAVAMSIPWHMSRPEAQAFLEDHSSWLQKHVGLARAEEESVPKDGRIPLWGRLVELPEGLTADVFYRQELMTHLPEVVARMEAATDQQASGWQLRPMKTRWGSCTPSTGRIRLNTRLAAYPPTCLDYVVAHELTHLAEPSHNARFHTLLAKVYADEAEARRMLRQSPRALAENHQK